MKFTGSGLHPISFKLNDDYTLCNYTRDITFNILGSTIKITTLPTCFIEPSHLKYIQGFRFRKYGIFDFGTEYFTEAYCMGIETNIDTALTITFIIDEVKKDTSKDNSTMKCCIGDPSFKDDAMFWDLLSYGVGSLRGDGKFVSIPLRLSGFKFTQFKLHLSDDTLHTLNGKYFPNHPDIKDDDIVKVSIVELTKKELILGIISIDSKKDEPLDDVALMLKSLDKRLSCWHKEYKELLDRYTNLLKKVGK